MKKVISIILITFMFCLVFSWQTIFVSHYVNNYGEEIQASVSPFDGLLYVIMADGKCIIFKADGVTRKFFNWDSDEYYLSFTRDGKTVYMLEYSTEEIYEYHYFYSHNEAVE